MPVTKEDFLRGIEDSFADSPEISGVRENLKFDGVKGRWSPLISHPFINLVGAATLDQSNADATIKQVLAFFAQKELAFGWMIGPQSTPKDLDTRLEAAGLKLAYTGAGMALTNMNLSITTNPEVMIRVATEEDREDVIRLTSDAYPVPRGVAEIIMSMSDAVGTKHYLAFIDGVDKPISVATMHYMKHAPIVAMKGAATLPEYRGRGIYTALMAKRLADARANGMEGAIIQADRSTSAPICAKLGFEEVASANIYAWMPETNEKDLEK